ncbi:hypothetical protein SAMN02745126_05407 [Enhydrobacter aerosaccus]|uniref:Uncharacterized protein n=1 Tax=Enhydrobacter aerosaccus TaxID=225324 RepID=A0A1T4T0V9_9HYPH|nr:hypothetical protein [Enhydrobacter aerosaccus]SKA33798.1 hypothetical protein SAMN02745126_05407 [Enhydrobacter aerosaccus]
MNRRAFLFASVATSIGGAAVRAEPGRIEMIYVGGWDCPYCTTWKNKYKADWLASPEFKRVTWVEVDPPRLRDAYQARYWPGDLAEVLNQVPRKSGTPRFLIVQDGRIVSNEFGVSKWLVTLEHLHKLLG